jgi:TolB protein
MRFGLVIAGVTLVVHPAVTGPKPPSGAPAPTLERIAFSCEAERVVDEDADNKTAIFTMNADGTDVVQRTNGVGHDEYPAWSPDGSRIVFESRRDGRPKTLYIMNADGSELRPLLPSPGEKDCPTNTPCRAQWSPDGKRIAFGSGRHHYAGRIHLVGADGTGLKVLVPGADDGYEADGYPTWSPDGRQIAFHHYGEGTHGIDVVEVDTPLNRRSLPGRFSGKWLAWSPDGGRLLYAEREPNGEEVHEVGLDGSGDRRLTPSMESFNIFTAGNWVTEPAWSPDGRRIVYSRHSGLSDRLDLWVMDADGSNKKQLLKGRFKHSYARGAAWVRPRRQ